MAEFTNEALGLRFTVPDKITVRRQLAYRDKVWGEAFTRSFSERFFLGAIELMDEWECELLPDPHTVDLDAETNPRVADIVQWAANQVTLHLAGLEAETKKG